MFRGLLLALTVAAASTAEAQDASVALDASVSFYGDNSEFFNPFSVGETRLGAFTHVLAEARTSPKLAFRLGVFGNFRFESNDSVEQVRPVVAIVVGGMTSRLILGTLETVRRIDGSGPDRTGPHSLLPPIQAETLAFDRPWEAGLQWMLDTTRLTQEAWLNWQRVNRDGQREVFDTGLKSRLRLNPAAAIRGEVFLVHQGGQRGGDGPVADSLSGALGADIGGAAGPLDRMGLEALVLASRYVPDRERTADARAGFATLLRVSAEKAGWRAHGLLWRGDDFVAREGDRNYQSIRRDGSAYRALRDYAEAGLARTFDLAPRSWLEASARWHRVENNYEYSFRILAVARLRLER
jgi:hypothetical protein